MSAAARQAGSKIAQRAGQAAASADARGGNALRKGARRDPELYVSRSLPTDGQGPSSMAEVDDVDLDDHHGRCLHHGRLVLWYGTPPPDRRPPTDRTDRRAVRE